MGVTKVNSAAAASSEMPRKYVKRRCIVRIWLILLIDNFAKVVNTDKELRHQFA